MTKTNVLDDYYLSITLLITIIYQPSFFIAFALKFDRLTLDFAGGTNFVLAITTVALSGNILSSLFMIQCSHLSGFLLFLLSILGLLDFPNGLGLDSLAPHHVSQLPQNPFIPPTPFVTVTDIISTILFGSGLLVESIADAQKYSFRSGPGGLDKSLFMRTRCCKYSRHPNYFGEIILHFGIWLITISLCVDGSVKDRPAAAQYAAVVGPIFLMVLLLFLSGLPSNEKSVAKRRFDNGNNWEEYNEYLRCTSILIPMPRRVWAALPTVVKRTIGFEFPIHVFDPNEGSTAGDGGDQQALRE
ncbi:DUF1295-domain-containing protein [Choiromyces venosus 120613-1]|uniref:DUF1295-domain-containing protein n=1 Tax=Choiromyces venosus 120613-1 TaxID=1336337 RepID=A0A3N4JFS7_9PEZI|nr:DUF1295-domain-containing protein [Choiromyces venosus 120613-1]